MFLVIRLGGGETSGGSLRSSRQAVACHPLTVVGDKPLMSATRQEPDYVQYYQEIL